MRSAFIVKLGCSTVCAGGPVIEPPGADFRRDYYEDAFVRIFLSAVACFGRLFLPFA
jgi:hypothetical protein